MPFIIGVANEKGGVGKTTTAVDLAAAMAATRGVRVLIADTDIQGSIKELHDAMEARAKAEQRQLAIDVGPTQAPATIGELRRIRGMYDYIIIDTPSNLDAIETTNVLRVAYLMILPCVPEFQAVGPTRRTVMLCRRYDVGHVILLNMVDPNRKGTAGVRRLFEAEGIPCLDAEVRRYVAIPQAQLEAVLLSDYRGDRSWSKARSDIRDVYLEVSAMRLAGQVTA
jgi:chromosome partitioning protein